MRPHSEEMSHYPGRPDDYLHHPQQGPDARQRAINQQMAARSSPSLTGQTPFCLRHIMILHMVWSFYCNIMLYSRNCIYIYIYIYSLSSPPRCVLLNNNFFISFDHDLFNFNVSTLVFTFHAIEQDRHSLTNNTTFINKKVIFKNMVH